MSFELERLAMGPDGPFAKQAVDTLGQALKLGPRALAIFGKRCQGPERLVYGHFGANGILSAVGVLYRPRTSEWRIEAVAVPELHRGRGLGRLLVGALEHIALVNGAETLDLAARIDLGAPDFFEHLGFEPQWAWPNGDVEFSKTLRPATEAS